MFKDFILSLKITAFSKSKFSLAFSICSDKFFCIFLDFPETNSIASSTVFLYSSSFMYPTHGPEHLLI